MKCAALQTLLKDRFSDTDAQLLEFFFMRHGTQSKLSYADIYLEIEDRNDLILLGYEERILLPVQITASPAWENRALDFNPGGSYLVTTLARQIKIVVEEQGRFSREAILTRLFPELEQDKIHGIYLLLCDIMANSGGFMFEAGLLKLYHEKYDFGLDLHDTLDLFVIGSLMSPCPQKSLVTGLSWYEISPALFWG